jgi:hypothetical protein
MRTYVKMRAWVRKTMKKSVKDEKYMPGEEPKILFDALEVTAGKNDRVQQMGNGDKSMNKTARQVFFY